MKYRAFLSRETLNEVKPEKEFWASTPERLREFIETYWINLTLPDNTWRRMLEEGESVSFPYDGTIHIEVEE